MPQIGEIKTARELGLDHKQQRRKFVWVSCPGCGKERWVAKGEHPRYCLRCYCKGQRDYRLNNHPNWKGGRRMENGYWTIKLDMENPYHIMCNSIGYIREHRYVMAKSLGRLLGDNEIVHHLNGVRDDNRIENLANTTHDKHEYQTLLKLAQKRIRELELLLTPQSKLWDNYPDKPQRAVKVVV